MLLWILRGHGGIGVFWRFLGGAGEFLAGGGARVHFGKPGKCRGTRNYGVTNGLTSFLPEATLETGIQNARVVVSIYETGFFKRKKHVPNIGTQFFKNSKQKFWVFANRKICRATLKSVARHFFCRATLFRFFDFWKNMSHISRQNVHFRVLMHFCLDIRDTFFQNERFVAIYGALLSKMKKRKKVSRDKKSVA